MGLKQTSRQWVDYALPKVLFGSSRLPTYYLGRVIWPSRNNWTTVYSRYEPQMGLALKELLHEGHTFLDVGAHVGWFSLYASMLVGAEGKVVSFEASPETFRQLKLNTSAARNVEPLHCGVGDHDGTADFAAQANSTGNSFVEDVTRINSTFHPEAAITKVAVRIARLDTFVRERGVVPDVIKIDVEGYELHVLRGAEELLASRRSRLVMEIHPVQLRLSGQSDSEVLALLKRHGYQHRVIDKNHHGIYTVVATP